MDFSVYAEYRICMIFMLAFVGVFSSKKVKTAKAWLYAIAIYGITFLVEYFQILSAGGERNYFYISLLDVVFVEIYSLLIGKYRDLRAVLVANCAGDFILVGHLAYQFMMYQTGRALAATFVGVCLHSALFIFLYYFNVEDVRANIDTFDTGWGKIALLSAVCWVAITLMTSWPVSCLDNPQVFPGVAVFEISMITAFFVVSAEMSKRRESKQPGIGSVAENLTGKVTSRRMLTTFLIILVLLTYSYSKAFSNGSSSYVLTPDKNTGNKNYGVELNIIKRGGISDSWEKVNVEMIEGDTVYNASLVGSIYDAVVINHESTQISDWKLHIVVEQECYLNNAWCGQVQITQHRDNSIKTQTIDLRSYIEANIALEHTTDAGDVLIHLLPGDEILYMPDVSTHENTIVSPLEGDHNSVTVGFIFYTEKGEPEVSVDNYKLTCQLESDPTKDTLFLISLGLMAVWITVGITVAVMNRRFKQEQLIHENDRKAIDELMGLCISVVDAKDSYTTGHSIRVATYSRMIAEELGMETEQCTNIYNVAKLHDIGKVGIPDAVLFKPGRLNDEEFAVIKSHTTRGYEILHRLNLIQNAAIGARSHHERYDGTGYPDGLSGEQIPYIARIICVADAFDAMNSDRVYRKKLTHEQIMAELKNGKGTQFDPAITDAFLRILESKNNWSEAENKEI